MVRDGCQTPQHVLDQIQLQKEKAMAALDLAARNAIDSARELRYAKDTIALLESGIKLPAGLVSSHLSDHANHADSQTILRLQGEIASLKAEIDAMKTSHAAVLSNYRSQLHAANYGRIAAESQLKRLQVGFLQTQESIQSSLAKFNRVLHAPERQAPIATPPPMIAAGGEQLHLLAPSNGMSPSDDLPPDSLTAINDDERQAAKRARITPRFDKIALQEAFAPGSSTVSGALHAVSLGLDEKSLSDDELLQVAADSIGRASSSCQEQHSRFLSELFCHERMRSLRDKFVSRLWRLVVMAPGARSASIETSTRALAQICLRSNRTDLLRIFIFDLLRLRSCLEIELLAIVFRIVPNVLGGAGQSALRDSIVAVICDALHCLPEHHTIKRDIVLNPFWASTYRQHNPADFASGAQSAIDQIVSGDADRVVDGTRALELIALSRGWPWTCSFIVRPLWQQIRSASNWQVVVHSISAMAIVGRTSCSDSANTNAAAFMHQIVSGLYSFLEAAFPIEIQVAAADALVVLANGRLSNLRDLYKWFVTAPDTVRSLVPSSLRDDITFIGKQLSVR